MRCGVACTIPVAAVLLGGVLGCSGDADEVGPPHDGEPTVCEVPSVAMPDGSCLRPGIAPGGCSEGFVHDGEYGCEPILPPEPCPFGQLAVPGETECRPVMPCGEGRWGDIPVDGATVHVDAAYAAGGSDGSADRPFVTVGEAVAAAALGALIAVAEGRYQEDVAITGKPVRLWGRCPAKVELVGSGVEPAALIVTTQTNGTEVRGLAISGPAIGVAVSGAQEVLLEQLWVHDNAWRGIQFDAHWGVTSVRLSGSLVEQNHDIGVMVSGSDAIVESTVVRATLPQASDQRAGRGINVQPTCSQTGCDPSSRSNATIRGSLIEGNHDSGMTIFGSDATIESTVVRGTLPRVSDQGFGRGIQVLASCAKAGCDPTARANATIRGSLIDNNQEVGLHVAGSDATIERTIVRGTLPAASTQMGGRGINIQPSCTQADCDTTMRPNATIRESLVDNNHDIGLFVMSSDAVVESTVVRATSPRASDQRFGRGINVQLYCDLLGACHPDSRSSATIHGSLVDNNLDIGLIVIGSDAAIDKSIVRATLPRASDGLFGDGVAAVSDTAAARATLTQAVIADSARAGVASFGGTTSLSATHIRCAAFALNGETYQDSDFVFEDGGGNACGCPVADGACKAVSAGLEPPQVTSFE